MSPPRLYILSIDDDCLERETIVFEDIVVIRAEQERIRAYADPGNHRLKRRSLEFFVVAQIEELRRREEILYSIEGRALSVDAESVDLEVPSIRRSRVAESGNLKPQWNDALFHRQSADWVQRNLIGRRSFTNRHHSAMIVGQLAGPV